MERGEGGGGERGGENEEREGGNRWEMLDFKNAEKNQSPWQIYVAP